MKHKKIFSYILIMSFVFVTFIPYVKADYYLATFTSLHYTRTGPGTNYAQSVTAPKGETAEMVSLTVFPDESPSKSCPGGWYQVYYNSSQGKKITYACSSLITYRLIAGEPTDKYDRPWTTPEKSIFGGAKFIANGYINAGQDTSYLKKFNVTDRNTFANQYMANVQAPLAEALKTYKAYRDSGILDLPMVFKVPVYNNMNAESYKLSGNPSNDKQVTPADQEFENSISAFPESYKNRLRELHALHPNWKFEVFNTNLDYDYVVTQEKYVSTINNTNQLYCEVVDGSCKPSGEAGWYMVNYNAAAYLLDPRNSLTEDRVYMFEKLSFSTNHTTGVIQNVLNGTHMEGNSSLDKKSYAQIFFDAGKNAGVSAVYLASLSVQETHKGNKVGSMSTTGEQFEYNGVTYKGVYNFYNIGAYGSEASPVRAGLVYACNSNSACIVQNGGGTGGGETPTTNPIPGLINNSGYRLSNTYIVGVQPNTTVSAMRSKFGGASVVVTNSNGENICDSCLIGTGLNFKISQNGFSNSYTTLLYGDINQNGEIDSGDLLKVKQMSMNGSFHLAADVNKDGKVDSGDILLVKKHLLGQVGINQ